ncbi:TIGR03905 family TSCPD domain-containing protein [Thermobrachium celere]|uniref:ribonucleoside-diphosphate reductase n=1 Tax=Thermobrachium celere DSM 8682 TaxID=941824 RepID=R7RQL7_9CLOT|nr:TIGR03905 family TSCPD domain-containing protein [Thermobrachium celere]GFR36185.1 TSCPD domain-containing protein [Thermobrachium celere]CDF57520.1 hypothetical protein TCEL_01434 [Thermobrachium celere DSM 8682]
MYSYKPISVCADEILFDIKDNKITNVEFVGGCPGNAIGIASLLEGMEVEEAIKRLKGIKCGSKNTSCPDQFAKALEEIINR